METISFEADLDATDQLEFPDQHAATVAHGLAPQIALLESLSQPSSVRAQTIAASVLLPIAYM